MFTNSCLQLTQQNPDPILVGLNLDPDMKYETLYGNNKSKFTFAASAE
jgi:hypothetical protein